MTKGNRSTLDRSEARTGDPGPRKSRGMTRSVLLLVLLAPAVAAAGTTPLSALPAKPARYAQAPGPVPAKVESYDSGRTIHAAASACLTSAPPAYWIDGDAEIGDRLPELALEIRSGFGIERLVTRGDGAELERIKASVIYSEIVPSARSRIPLQEVAKLDGLVVHAYRWDAKVFLIVRSSGTTLFRRDGASSREEAPDCPFAYTMLRVRGGASQMVQLEGTVPGTGKQFVVDASVAQTGRDPEPLLSVTARLVER
jgi:hypothetical protein